MCASLYTRLLVIVTDSVMISAVGSTCSLCLSTIKPSTIDPEANMIHTEIQPED